MEIFILYKFYIFFIFNLKKKKKKSCAPKPEPRRAPAGARRARAVPARTAWSAGRALREHDAVPVRRGQRPLHFHNSIYKRGSNSLHVSTRTPEAINEKYLTSFIKILDVFQYRIEL